jgi:flagellar basal-body rod modification protein FlgD
MNATLNSLGAQMSAATNIQATQLVGRDVVANGNGVVVNNGVVQGSFTLDSQADTVNVDVLGRNGSLLGTVTVGTRGPGLQQFEWPLGNVDPEAVGRIEVRATRGGEAVAATPLARQRVESVAFVDGAIRLRTDSGTLEYGQVLAFL